MEKYMKVTRGITLTLTCSLAFMLGCSKSQFDSASISDSEFSDGFQSDYFRSQIVNGEPVKAEDPVSKSTVALYLADKANNGATTGSIKTICTGTLIAKNIVLTAGHCILDVAEVFLKVPLEELRMRLRVGFGIPVVKNESDSNVSFVRVKKFLVHPKYKANMVKNAKRVPMPDLTVLLLESDAPENYVPAKFSDDLNLIQEGTELTLSGYGYTSGTRFTLPTQLMKVNVNVSSPHFTSAQFQYKSVNGKSACMGDSGGPAYYTDSNGELTLVGVTSWGDNTCTRYGVYTSVPVFAEFITSAIEVLTEQTVSAVGF